MITSLPILSILIWLPILGGLLVLVTRKISVDAVRWLSLLLAALTFVVSVALAVGFDSSRYEMQFSEHISWIQFFDIFYSLGVDGISVPLILLTTIITVLVVIAGWDVSQENIAGYYELKV